MEGLFKAMTLLTATKSSGQQLYAERRYFTETPKPLLLGTPLPLQSAVHCYNNNQPGRTSLRHQPSTGLFGSRATFPYCGAKSAPQPSMPQILQPPSCSETEGRGALPASEQSPITITALRQIVQGFW